jgi:hypothetical protein
MPVRLVFSVNAVISCRTRFKLEDDSRSRIKHVAQLNKLSLLNRNVGAHSEKRPADERDSKVERSVITTYSELEGVIPDMDVDARGSG